MEGDGRAFALNEQPGWRAQFRGHASGQRLGRVAVTVEARLRHHTPGDGRGAPAARHHRVLQSVVAEILDTADADARRDIGDGPSGQDRHVKSLGSGRCDPRQVAECPLCRGLDPRDSRVA